MSAASATDWKPGKGGLPLAAALAGALLLRHISKGVRADTAQAQGSIDMKRQMDANRNYGDNANLMGRQPLSYPGAMSYQAEMADSNTPNYAGFDKNAEAVAEAAGRLMAKRAGIGGMLGGALGAINKAPNALLRGAQAVVKPIASAVPSLGFAGKAIGGAALVGGGLMAAKAGRKALDFGNAPTQVRQPGAGPGLPRGVNEYGVPE